MGLPDVKSVLADPNAAPGAIAAVLAVLNGAKEPSASPEELADAANSLQALARDPACKNLVSEAGRHPAGFLLLLPLVVRTARPR